MRSLLLALCFLPLAVTAGCGSPITRTIVVTATPGLPTPTLPTPGTTAPRPTAAPRSSSLTAFTLTSGDVGQGFTQVASSAHSNAQVAATYHLSAADLRRRGRLTSYETAFQQPSPTGIVAVDDVVARWRTPVGAK